MSLRRSVIVAAALLATCAGTAAAGPWSLAPGEYYAELSGSLLSSNSRYDATGTRVMRGGLLETRTYAPYLDLGWKKRVSVQMSLPIVSNSVSDKGRAFAATNSGFGDVGLGLRVSLINGRDALAYEVEWKAPAGYDRRLDPAAGSGLQSMQSRLQFGHTLGAVGFVQAGFGARTDFRSITDLGKFSTDAKHVSARFEWSEQWLYSGALGLTRGHLLAAATYDGVVDQASGIEGRGVTQQRIGSRITYRVDPRLDTFLGSWHVPFGKNAAHFDEYYAGLAWKLTKLGPQQGFLGGRP